MSARREDNFRREKGKALVRALHLSELEAAGAARTLALHEAEKQLDRVARLLPNALQAGISITEIARATGVSRPTLYELQGRYGGSLSDLRLGVLQTIAVHQPMDQEQLRLLFDERPEVGQVLVDLANEGLVELETEDTPDGQELILTLAPDGYESLEHWDFELDTQESERQGEP